MYIRYSILFVGLILISACSPKVSTGVVSRKFPPVKEFDPFVVYDEDDTISFMPKDIITTLKVGDSGFTFRCDYYTMLNILIQKSKELGANAIKITKHKLPDFMSSCHRFEATAYHLDEIWKYEKEITWTANRKLEYRDFKASVEDRPFQAATLSKVFFYFEKVENSKLFALRSKAIFITNKSYFKKGEEDEFTLKHEQLHFDISELHARKFFKKMKERNVKTYKQIEKCLDDVIGEIDTELDKMQDKYDAEVYSDRDAQVKWDAFVASELKALEAYAHMKLAFKL